MSHNRAFAAMRGLWMSYNGLITDIATLGQLNVEVSVIALGERKEGDRGRPPFFLPPAFAGRCCP